MIIKGYFYLFLHKNVCCVCSLESPCQGDSNDLTQHTFYGGPDSLVVRASTSGAVDCGFAPRSRHTKGVKNGTSSSLSDARIKG